VTPWVEGRVAAVRELIELELDSMGVDMVDTVRENCSEPVIPTASGWPIRSEPGENPFRETGHLWESFGHAVITLSNGVELEIYNTAHYAYRLHWNLNRPFFDYLTQEYWPQVNDRLRDALQPGR
jgi:hypothetical protein